ncbi:cytoplasmic tRNA 2-thiolation protein 2 [Tachyglossus aculeatus]|uniref:cytoplasmic tRNA 2-thiolation protein 2 n=1 Tax=Tachyglossus aculeatus TaxID=9261 RepID=UPI0018F35DA2|nr:cytoplasmic tRNA 2-thiolation protein 2 [Tachyglossus aculeatus]
MCQAGEDYGPEPPGHAPRGHEPRLRGEQKCMKCKEGLPVLIIRAGDAFCKDCFKAYYVHKFRAMLGKNRLIFPGEKVLLAWSGGPSSSSMVSQVQEGLSRESTKRLRFVPGIVYVDEGAVCGQSPEDRAKTLAQVESVLQTTGFPYHVVPLEEVFNLPTSVLRCPSKDPPGSGHNYKEAVDGFIRQQRRLHGGEAEDDYFSGGEPEVLPELRQVGTREPARLEEKNGLSPVTGGQPPAAAHTAALTQLFGSAKTLTAKEELLQTLRTHLILHLAREKGYSKVMVGDSCTRLAIKLMTNLALGRGAFLALDTGFSDSRHGDVTVIRPMRDHTLKEIAFYNRMFAVPSVFSVAIDTKAPEKASIHRLMESFVLKLQAEFPSTVSTVYRTSEKLIQAPPDGRRPPLRCLLCQCHMDVDRDGTATAFWATRISEQLSQKPPPPPPGRSCCSRGAGDRCCRNTRPPGQGMDSRANFLQLLCYGCRVNMRDLPSMESFPPYILTEARTRSHRARMKEEIQEFLLEDSEEEAEPRPE